MGVVWRARDTALDRDVAIKFLPAAFAHDPERLLRFEREAKAVAALSHPNILSIHGFGEHEGSAYAVTELLEGSTLREVLAGGALPVECAIPIAREISRGLAAAHDRGILHRDLKPENVFVTRDGHTKILDFGLAANAGPAVSADPSDSPTRTSLTTPGTVLGTVGYLSPEQVRGAPADKRSDVFSFGTLIHEMLSGRRPFERETAAETMTAILREEPPALTGIPSPLVGVVKRCLAKRPEDRFASARELATALETSSGMDPTSRRGPVAIAAASIFALLLAGVAWRVLLPRTQAPDPPPKGASISFLGEPPSPVAEANEYFEKGLLMIRVQLDIPRARKMLDRAIELDPEFGSARAVRSLTDLIAIHEGFSNDAGLVYACERESRAVLGKQPGLSSAHGVHGAALLYLNRKAQAREEIAEALRLDSRSQAGLAWRTLEARLSGRLEEAEAGARAHLEAVPLFWAMRIMLVEILLDQERIEDARREIEKVFEQDPGNLGAIRALVRLEIYEGDTAAARKTLQRVPAENRSNFRVRLLESLLAAREGTCDAAEAALDPDTIQYAGIALFAPEQIAEIHALCGRSDEALDWLDRAVRSGDERSEWFRKNALLANLRDEPRFRWILETLDRGKGEAGGQGTP